LQKKFFARSIGTTIFLVQLINCSTIFFHKNCDMSGGVCSGHQGFSFILQKNGLFLEKNSVCTTLGNFFFVVVNFCMTRKKQLFKILLILHFLPICSSRLFNLLSNNFEFSNAQSQRGSRLGEIDFGSGFFFHIF